MVVSQGEQQTKINMINKSHNSLSESISMKGHFTLHVSMTATCFY